MQGLAELGSVPHEPLRGGLLPWGTWWERNAGRLRKLMSPGAFLRLRWTGQDDRRRRFAATKRQLVGLFLAHGAEYRSLFEPTDEE